MKKIFLSLAFAAAFLALAPAALANTASVVSITPEAEDLSAMIGDTGDDPAGIYLSMFSGTIDTDYTIVYSVDAEPAMLVVNGAQLNTWTYDENSSTITVDLSFTGFIEGVQDFGPYNPFMVAITWPVAIGEDGPPAEMTGSWMSTNLMEWQMVPPEPGLSPSFGYILTGPVGQTGLFKMFMVDGIKDLLSELSGETLEWSNLAVFLDDDQASMSITEVEGGALVDIEVTFAEDATQVASLASAKYASSEVTKTITVAEQEEISFACKSYNKSRGENFTCFGWVDGADKGDKVRIMRKTLGKKTWKQHKITTIKNSSGYFTVRLTMKKKTASYKAYYVKDKIYSSAKKVRLSR